ncbi:MAG: restriction endonuclease [Candidatus Aegiribacteria sp.]|nr:restriction endonuclease [Candidatus Aegiribacteria sp.]
MNKLYFGDCLDVMRESIPDESVDLVYLDPPFNSKRAYNLLFSSPKGEESKAQITAFEDTWAWGVQAESEFAQLFDQSNTDVSEMMRAFRQFLGESDVMAYLTMMANRLIEIHRVMKSSASVYLHCDPTASHYLKILCDAVFGADNYVNEIIWQRYGVHNDVFQGSKHFGRIHDTILFYSKGSDQKWVQLFTPLDTKYINSAYRYIEEETGRRFRATPLTGPGGAAKGNPVYEWNGHTRAWRYSEDRMRELDEKGLLYYSRTGYVSKKKYLDESKGVPVQDIWDDIKSLSGGHSERLGFPTQKPISLLERIINTSSDPGDIILDPFCGCGTAVHAAHKLDREWIGIDITHLAIALIEKRLSDAFSTIKYEVIGTPKSIAGAQDLADRDKYQFQWWACSIVNAQPYKGKKKGADTGIDGIIYFQDEKGTPKKIIVSVKGGKNVHRDMIADLKNTVEREKAQIGLFVTLTPPTKPMVKEACSAGFYESPHFSHIRFPKIQILTIEGLLDEIEYAKYPDLSQGAWTFKKAQLEEMKVAQDQKDLFNQNE